MSILTRTSTLISAFEGNDQADTYLGNVAAGVVTDANAKITVKADVTLTATQID